MAKFKILSIDGGGIKGIISAVVIERIEKILMRRTGNPDFKIADFFDLIAGTSTGAILAGIYLCPDENGRPKYSASDALRLYVENGEYIFDEKTMWELKTLFGFRGPKYNNDRLKNLIEKYLGDLRLSEFVKPCLLTAYDMGRGAPHIFNSRFKTECCRNIYAKDALLASAAAPTYFPPALIESKEENGSFFIDGGVFSNNPAMCAVTEALRLSENHRLEDIAVLSVGNTRTDEHYKYEKSVNYGMLRWVLPSIHIMMEGSVENVHEQLITMYRSISMPWQYLRIDAGKSPHGETPRMDDASLKNINKLVKMGEDLTKESEHKLRRFVEMFIV